jgi:DNA-binding NarL/FixJ family response regulator
MLTGVMRNDLSRPGAESASARKIRVVLVDDSDLSMTFLIHVLETFPRVQIAGQAEDGLDGFALAARLQPDLVFTDLQMPGRDGFQLVALLRQTYPAIRSIITSAHDGPICYAASLQHGADAFISKRCLLDEFPHQLNRLFPDTAEPATSTCQE